MFLTVFVKSIHTKKSATLRMDSPECLIIAIHLDNFPTSLGDLVGDSMVYQDDGATGDDYGGCGVCDRIGGPNSVQACGIVD